DHVERRLIDLDRRQRDRVVKVGDGVADIDVLQADDGADVAGAYLVCFDAAQPIEDVELGDGVVHARGGAGMLHEGDGLALANPAGDDGTDRNAPDIVAVVEGGHQHLQRL